MKTGINNEFFALAALLMFLAADRVFCQLTTSEMNQLCEDKYMQLIASPNDLTHKKFIVCLSDRPQEMMCLDVTTDQGLIVGTCFDDQDMICSVEACQPAGPNPEYATFMQTYCTLNQIWLKSMPAEDCEHYYVCFGSSAPLYDTCPNGMHFSRDQRQCLPPLEAGCQVLDNLCYQKRDGHRFAATDCHKYYECRNESPVEFTCKYNYHYDIESQQCIHSTKSSCIPEKTLEPECSNTNNGALFAHKKCNKYYVCINKIAYEAQCAPGFYYDEQKGICNRDGSGLCEP